jgi:ATP-dependent Clp protease ATP-binding subunit ClpA
MGLDKWSEEGRKAILRAPTEARNIGHSYTGSEHLLLALLNSETSLATRVLKELGVTKIMVENKIVEVCKRMEMKSKTKERNITNLVAGRPFTIKII